MSDTTDTTISETTDDTTTVVTTAVEPAEADASADVAPALPDDVEPAEDADTFTRDYVENLRQENGKYRQRAARADELAQRLHTELVRATGKLADPTDLPFDEDHIAHPDKIAAAIDELLVTKPHLAARRPTGDIGQGPSPTAAGVDLAAILRGKAG